MVSRRRREEWDPKIVQINVAEANIVDRCETCHMNAREPLRITPAAMMAKGEKKPDDLAHAFASHTEPELLSMHDPEKFGCSPCHQGNGRATTSVEKAHGNYEHWLWPLFPKQNAEAGCQTCHAADMHLAAGEVGTHISNGKFLYRQRGCMGCHRYEGYDKEPEDLTSITQQLKLFEQQKIDNAKVSANLMKQADSASSNDEANQLNQKAVALRVSNSKIDGRIQQLDFQTHSLMQDVKKIGPNLKDVRLKLNRDWIPVWLKKPTRFPADDQDAELSSERPPDSDHLGILVAGRIHRRSTQAEARQRRSRKGTVRKPRLPRLPLDWRRRPNAGWNVRGQSDTRRREGQLRLPGPLGSQRARTYTSILRVRKERHRARGLRQERFAVLSSTCNTASARTMATSCKYRT